MQQPRRWDAPLPGPLPTPSSWGEGTPFGSNGGTVQMRPGFTHGVGKGSPLCDLKQVLPAPSTGQIKWLLHQLRDEGRVRLVGKRRWGRWYLPQPTAVKPKRTALEPLYNRIS